MLRIALALTRVETGWLRQHPEFSEHLAPIPGLVSEDQIVAARANWNEACDICHKHCTGRVKEIQRVAKVHRDPFEPIMPILEADSPVGEYRKILPISNAGDLLGRWRHTPPSPLVGEGGSARSAETDEGSFSPPRLQTRIARIGDDGVADAVDVLQDIVVPETQDTEAAAFQFGVASSIVP
jgi:hypothetical protein